MKELDTTIKPNWCPGCGNLGLWASFKRAAEKEAWDNTNTVLVAGIGCHGHLLNFTRITSFEGLHGRALPVAEGIKFANHRLNVFVFTGDGDCLGEGGNHFIHACRRNHNLNVILHDNGLYALTTGQTSPATPQGMKTKSTPQGNPDNPFIPINLAIAAGATFVARGYAGEIDKLSDLIIEANKHQGLSVIDVLQPCATFNKDCTHQFYQANTYWLGEDYNRRDKGWALAKSAEFGEKQIALGVFYEEDRPTEESQYPQIAEKTLVDTSRTSRDITSLLQTYH